MHYTARRAEFMPYCVIRPVHEFITEFHDTHFLDWGCGENNHKLMYNLPFCKGIDRTPEADIYGYPNDVWDQIPQVDAILAINSIHFEKNLYSAVSRIIDQKLNDNGEIFFTANDVGHDDLKNYVGRERWEELGEVKYYYCTWDHIEELEKQMLDHIHNDQIARSKELDTNVIYNMLHTRTIKTDPFYGLLRVRIKKC